MRVALDATPLTVPTGGVTRYTAELSLALARSFPDDHYRLVSDQPFPMPADSLPNLKPGLGPANFRERRWWLWGLQGEMSRLQIDVFHGTDFSVPYLPLRPSVMMVHDLSPWMEPGWHTMAGRIRRRTPAILRLGLATMLVTPSETVRRQVMERFRVDGSRVRTVPLAAAEHFRPIDPPAHERPYFLYAGTLEPRKNIPLLIEAWREVRKTRSIDLILAGRRRADFPPLEPEPGLVLLGETKEEDLPGLYSGSVATLYPSWYEGFGLPVLEAMRCGAVVIASRDAAISEVAAGAALQLDAADPKAWIEAMQAVAGGGMQELRAKGRARAVQFSWEQTARLTHEVYEEARQRFRR